jgi:hypothetical protein
MIVTELYNGQGLGNQLWVYSVLRCLSKKLGYDFGIMSPNKFKGREFLDVDMGLSVSGGSGPEGGPPDSLPEEIYFYFTEKKVNHPVTGTLISKMDKSILEIEDGTKIEGNLQAIGYIEEDKDYLRNCIRIKDDRNIKDYSADNICIIHIRGGDFLGSTAFLESSYYKNAVLQMKKINSEMNFLIVTDDVYYAKNILPEYEIVGGSKTGIQDLNKADHHQGGPIWMDWSIIYNAKNLIISASSFSWWPAWLGNSKNTIAPMFWGDFKKSDGYWSCGDSLIKGWNYLDKEGNIHDYEYCLKRKEIYEETNKSFWL